MRPASDSSRAEKLATAGPALQAGQHHPIHHARPAERPTVPLRARAGRASGPGGEVIRAQRRGKPRLPIQVAPEILAGGEPGRDIIAMSVVGTCLSPEVRDGDLVIVDKRHVWPVHGCIMAFSVVGELHLQEYVRRDGRAYWNSNEGEWPVGGNLESAPLFIGDVVAVWRDGETAVLGRPRAGKWGTCQPCLVLEDDPLGQWR